jgi:15-cis-phytoene synthase
MKELFDTVSAKCSKLTTQQYSTSFSLGIQLLSKDFRKPIYGIYGFVRFADEILDSFHDYNKAALLEKFKKETYEALEEGISLNPIINSFQRVVKQYAIEKELIDTFFESMEMDLQKHFYNRKLYDKYILGSAEVVGLMCLKVFCNDNLGMYESLKYPAMKLGSALQKINFLRDIKADSEELGRTYFPEINLNNFSKADKLKIEDEIEKELKEAMDGIRALPLSSRRGVYLAYSYYLLLFKKIKNLPPQKILSERIRIANTRKIGLMFQSMLKHQFNM